jgi:GAF domain-containing protein
MKRRGGASGQRPKAARRSTAPKRRAARKPAGRRKPPETDLQSQLQDCTRELNAAHDQLTAMSEVLSVISGSAGDLKPVFDVLLANAVRICGARFGNLSLVEGDGMRMVAMHNAPSEFEKLRRREPIIPLERSPLGALFQTKKIVHIGDLAADKAYANAGLVKVAGARAALCVPMLRGDDLIGALVLYRMEPLPFTDKQVEQLTNFATQAVIAIENARLLSELRGSLARQTATSEILRVISRSPTDVRPVFDSIVLTAVRLLRCDLAIVHLCDNAIITHAAVASSEGLLTEAGLPNMPIDPSANFPSRAILDKKMLHLPDWSLIDLPEHERNIHQMVGVNSALYLPLLREGECIGLLTLVGKRPNSFGPSDIAQAESFRDQALIAIENSRLFNDVQKRTAELTESLEQQTATGEILSSISGSIADTKPVFDAIVGNLLRLFGTRFAAITLLQGGMIHMPAVAGEPGFERLTERYPRPLDDKSVGGQAMLLKETVQFAPVVDNPAVSPFGQQAARDFGYNSLVFTPMMRGDKVIGALGTAHREPKPFSDKQIALLRAFADQAVIAIENTRLLTELHQRTDDLSESLEQQTATSEVLRVISSSPGDLQPVFAAMLENAVRISGAKFGIIHSWDGESLRLLATHNLPPALNEARRRAPQFRPGPKTGIRRMAATKSVIHIPDLAEDKGYLEERAPQVVAAVEQGGVRTMLAVPMLKENEVVGAFTVYRQEVRRFTDKQIALITSFAAQAVIAVENARLLTELRQSLEQQTATADVLSVISSSPGDLKPVFDAMLGNAARLCEAQFGNLLLCEGEAFRVGAMHNMPPLFAERFRREPVFHAGPLAPVSRATATGEFVHIVDLTEDAAYKQSDPPVVAVVDAGGARSMIVVPMLKEGEAIGALSIFRREVRPFTDKQIDLVKNFAAQAVIAIENTRLLSELRESLAQQTATADVLRVISSSPGDLQPVFAAVLENATRICEANFGVLSLSEGDAFRVVGMHNAPPAFAELRRREPTFRPSGHIGVVMAQAIATKRAMQVADVAALDDPLSRTFSAATEARSIIIVPMLKENETIGAFTVYRKEVRPFDDKQTELLTNFAAQAVIAIENARLLTELRQRTNDLTESLEQQTATSEVLRVISSSPGQLEPVFAAILDNATRICQANFGTLFLREGEALRVAAHHGSLTKAWDEQWRVGTLVRPDASLQAFQTLSARQALQVVDLSKAPSYLARNPKAVNSVEVGGIRTMVTVPMLKDSEAIGVITIFRTEVREFTDKQIALVTSFAAQAVIAIENARLLTELRERTDELGRSVGELRALGEVSQAVNSTLDLETVLSTIVAKAVQLSNTEAGAIYVFDDLRREFHLRATYGMDRDLIDALTGRHIGLDETNIAMAIGQHEPIQVADLKEETSNAINEIILRAGFRARLTAPLMRGEDIVGMLVVRRRTPGAFPQNTVDLIKTFAAQSVLAIQNARLFENVETRTGELARSLKDLQTAQDRLVQTEKLASLGQLTAGIAHEIKNPLNFVNNFSAVSVELIDELREALGGVHLDSKLRAEIDEIADMLQGNLDKVVQHGKRADSIVKNMLLHSRAGSGEHRPVDINAIVEESLNLAYHGARAEKQGFNITLERSFDPAAGEVDLFPQEMTRVLLNLISNGFYAATKRKAEANGGNYEPTLSAATKSLGDSVEIRIRDNGTGIPPEVRDKMFNPFFTTKPAGEGTGLGLSLSHDIIVKQHSGSIEVDTKPGEFTEFRIVLPRGAATIAKPPESTSGENA